MATRYPETHGEPLPYMDEDDMDDIKVAIAYMLMRNTDMDKEMIYSIVFEEGDRIIWH